MTGGERDGDVGRGGVDCEAFDVLADELALGFVAEPERERLLAHAGACRRCGRLLRDLSLTADAMLELAPQVEPPLGFESRAVAGMGDASRPAVAPRLPLVAAAVAALLLVVGAGVFGVAALSDGGDRGPVRTADVMVASDGRRLGTVELVAAPVPKVVVVLDGPDDWEGTWGCELQRPDGTWVEVGRWRAEDAAGGAWATTIDSSLVDATAMRITAGDPARPRVIATSGPLR